MSNLIMLLNSDDVTPILLASVFGIILSLLILGTVIRAASERAVKNAMDAKMDKISKTLDDILAALNSNQPK